MLLVKDINLIFCITVCVFFKKIIILYIDFCQKVPQPALCFDLEVKNRLVRDGSANIPQNAITNQPVKDGTLYVTTKITWPFKSQTNGSLID